MPGDWLLILLHEHIYYKSFTIETDLSDLKSKWRYAFIITRLASTFYMPKDINLVVADIETFLAEVASSDV